MYLNPCQAMGLTTHPCMRTTSRLGCAVAEERSAGYAGAGWPALVKNMLDLEHSSFQQGEQECSLPDANCTE
jgi:hypothetical protein